MNALGATGRLVFHKIVRKSVDRKLSELREIYLQSLMLSTKITPELIEDLEVLLKPRNFLSIMSDNYPIDSLYIELVREM